jgi:hypothetical protein
LDVSDEAPDGRLRDDPGVDPGLRSLLDGMRADVPDAAHVDRLAAGARARASMASPWLKAGAVVGLVLAALALYLGRPDAPPPPTAPPPAPVAVPEPAPVIAPIVAPSVAPLPDRPPPPAPRRARRALEVETEIAPPEPLAPPIDVVVEAPPSPPASPEDELALLAAARRALRTDASRALALVAEHRAHFPSSAFAEERAVLEVDALLRSGRRVEAERAAEALLRRWPGSVHRHHLEESLAAP